MSQITISHSTTNASFVSVGMLWRSQREVFPHAHFGKRLYSLEEQKGIKVWKVEGEGARWWWVWSSALLCTTDTEKGTDGTHTTDTDKYTHDTHGTHTHDRHGKGHETKRAAGVTTTTVVMTVAVTIMMLGMNMWENCD